MAKFPEGTEAPRTSHPLGSGSQIRLPSEEPLKTSYSGGRGGWHSMVLPAEASPRDSLLPQGPPTASWPRICVFLEGTEDSAWIHYILVSASTAGRPGPGEGARALTGVLGSTGERPHDQEEHGGQHRAPGLPRAEESALLPMRLSWKRPWRRGETCSALGPGPVCRREHPWGWDVPPGSCVQSFQSSS